MRIAPTNQFTLAQGKVDAAEAALHTAQAKVAPRDREQDEAVDALARALMTASRICTPRCSSKRRNSGRNGKHAPDNPPPPAPPVPPVSSAA
ncbi:MAG: hypothetical protein ACHQ9S_24820 [Candidatus Binatia bacterium]